MRPKLFCAAFPYLLVSIALIAGNKAQALEIGLGASVNQHLVFIQNRDRPEETEAEFRSDLYGTPFLSLAYTPQYFGESRFGWQMEFNIGSYSVDTQVDPGGRKQDYGTGVSGVFGHMNPILFYRYGDRYMRGPNHWSLMLGLGYGVSFLTVDGTFVTDHQSQASQRKVSIDNGMGFFLLPAISTKLQFGHWFAGIFACFGGPGFEKDDYTYRLVFRSVTFGYIFEI